MQDEKVKKNNKKQNLEEKLLSLGRKNSAICIDNKSVPVQWRSQRVSV